ncbi:MAG: TPM domain-containing protein [Bacteroidales bacterium]
MKPLKKTLPLLISFALFFSGYLPAQDIPERPSPPRLVNDFTNTLTGPEIRSLENTLVRFSDTTSNQIAIVIVNSFNGIYKAEFADRIGEQWGVGQAGFDNGIVIVLKPRQGNQKGEVWIATGYGLEGAIPDAIANRIIDHEMIPEFKKGDYYAGLKKASGVLMSLAAGEFSADEYANQTGPSPLAYLLPFIIIIAIYLLIRLSARRRSQTLGHHVPLWTAFWLGSSMGGRSSGGWGSTGGGFGGGGSFGGFGGGSFGGGGAGGSW